MFNTPFTVGAQRSVIKGEADIHSAAQVILTPDPRMSHYPAWVLMVLILSNRQLIMPQRGQNQSNPTSISPCLRNIDSVKGLVLRTT